MARCLLSRDASPRLQGGGGLYRPPCKGLNAPARLQTRSHHPARLDSVPFKSLYQKEILRRPHRRRLGAANLPLQAAPPGLAAAASSASRCCSSPAARRTGTPLTCGDFVKHLLFFGVDIHILELRGHGSSSRELQLERAAASAARSPPTWTGAGTSTATSSTTCPRPSPAVKAKTGRTKIFYFGNSMGGMLGYGYAGSHDDLAGLVAIGAPSDIGPRLSAACARPRSSAGADGPAARRRLPGRERRRSAPAMAPAALLRRMRPLARAANLLAAPEPSTSRSASTTCRSTRSCARWPAPRRRATSRATS